MSGLQQALLSLIANVTQLEDCFGKGHEKGIYEPRTTRTTRNFNGPVLFVYSAYFAVASSGTRTQCRRLYVKHPALLRQLELEALAALAKNANARIYIGFDKHLASETARNED